VTTEFFLNHNPYRKTMTATIYLGLGTNLGNRLENLSRAMDGLRSFTWNLEASPIYETPPWGYTDQPEFLNQVIRAETDLQPAVLLTALKDLEAELGRQETFRYGPRLIDLDLLFYNQLVLQTPELVIPHPQMHVRAFVLIPLADLAPGLVHPLLGKTIQALAAAADNSGVKQYIPQGV
jgi:2-amino-4-hydroxy-6-hydroxymethyldihydropteridine diphosphokinase